MRFLRRLGGMVRGAVASITRRGSPQRPDSPTQAAPTAQPPAPPRRPRTQHRRPAAPPAPSPEPTSPGCFAHWFGLSRRQARFRRDPTLQDGDAPYTPEANPGLSAEACAFLNTPVEDVDPLLLRLVLLDLAEHIAESMPQELGLDAKALFSTLWGRLGPMPGDPATDATPDEQPDEAPATPASPVPAAPCTAPDTQPEEPAAIPSAGAAISGMTATETAPGIAVLLKRDLCHRWPLRHRCRQVLLRYRSLFPRGLRNGPPCPPPRHLCYAACAGPP